jgi:hypothetical protein
MNRERGVTLTGLLVASCVLVFVALLGFKLFPPYMQYFSVQKVFKSIAANPEVKNGTRRDAMAAWARYAMIENINVISGEDIEVNYEGRELVLSASYSVKVPLFAHVSLLIDFNPTSVTR